VILEDFSMRHRACLLLLALVTLAWDAGPRLVRAEKKEEKEDLKSNLVVLDNLKSTAPTEWKREKRDNLLLKYQFRLARIKDDKSDAQAFISEVIGSGAADKKVKGWRDWFLPPEGKKIEDVSTIDKLKIGKKEAIYLDVQGTYLHKKRPQDPDTAAEHRPGYRMLAVYFETNDTPYFIRLIGPATTVTHYKKGFDEWLKAFK
jgi:hypothetical protein